MFQDLYFWLAILGATAIKMMTSAYQSLWRASVTVVISIFCAYVFTDPAVDFLNLDPNTYRIPMAALLALMGESFIRMMIGWLENNKEFLDTIIRAWRGHK